MKTGLMFGTFNPVHIGHLIIAQYMRNFTSLEEVWLVVSPHNPHKKRSNLLDDRQRLHMVHLALEDDYKLRTTDIEFGLPKPNYTAVTLAALKEKFPGKEFALILGQDNLDNFHRWRNSEFMLEHHEIYVYPRHPAPGDEQKKDDNGLLSHPHVHMTNAPRIEISSTFIRKALKNDRDVSYMLHPKVWDYLEGSSFYK